ncbi:MAG TPA: SRPBCC family protein [Burkholderiaceae bacterium]|nr:SRPBCC family protein [Burkholderiaceae bacterium]
MQITVERLVRSTPATVWAAWNTPADIERWNAASPDWHTPSSTVDLREGGGFRSRMEARDGSVGFDFEGTYTRVVEPQLIEYAMADGRTVRVEFVPQSDGVLVRETFDADGTHDAEMQRAGWQAILDSFARHVEAKGTA